MECAKKFRKLVLLVQDFSEKHRRCRRSAESLLLECLKTSGAHESFPWSCVACLITNSLVFVLPSQPLEKLQKLHIKTFSAHTAVLTRSRCVVNLISILEYLSKVLFARNISSCKCLRARLNDDISRNVKIRAPRTRVLWHIIVMSLEKLFFSPCHFTRLLCDVSRCGLMIFLNSFSSLILSCLRARKMMWCAQDEASGKDQHLNFV